MGSINFLYTTTTSPLMNKSIKKLLLIITSKSFYGSKVLHLQPLINHYNILTKIQITSATNNGFLWHAETYFDHIIMDNNLSSLQDKFIIIIKLLYYVY